MTVELMTIEKVEKLRDEYLGIKKQLEELKKELKDKSDSEAKKKAEDLNKEAQNKEKQLKEAIRVMKESKSSTEQDRKKAKEIEDALKTPTQEVGQLYNSIIESLGSSTGASSASIASTGSKSDENVFEKSWNWIKKQWGDVGKKEEWDKNPGTNTLRTLGFAATGVGAVALAYKGLKKLFGGGSSEKEDSSETETKEGETKGSKSGEPEEEKSFWDTGFGRTLKRLGFGSAAGGGIYFLGKQLNWWGSKDNKTDGKTDNNSDGKTDNGQGNKPQESKEKPKDSDIVSVKDYMPGIKYDLVYATSNNSFGTVIYNDGESNLKLRYDTIEKLIKVQESLKQQGLELKIWDAYRPKEAQQKLWDNYKGPAGTKGNNVAKPGTSHHGTGKAVDLTLVDSSTGKELAMPTGFDDFSGKAEWVNVNKNKGSEAFKNAYKLRDAMKKAGFYTIKSEWWHYQTDAPKEAAPEVPH